MAARATATIRSQRLNALPPYLFVEIDRAKRAKIASGADVIDLGVGDPDRPTPNFIIEALAEAARDPANHRYPPSIGTPGFRESAARFMKRRFGIDADPDRHICQCVDYEAGRGSIRVADAQVDDIGAGRDLGAFRSIDLDEQVGRGRVEALGTDRGGCTGGHAPS